MAAFASIWTDWFFWGVLVVILLWDPMWRLLGVRQLFPWELKRILRERPESVRLVDVRTPVEYALVRIQGADNDPALEFTRREGTRDAERPSSHGSGDGRDTVVVCMTGHRSPIAAWLHRRNTGEQTWNLTWGMVGWLLFGGPSVWGRGSGGPADSPSDDNNKEQGS